MGPGATGSTATICSIERLLKGISTCSRKRPSCWQGHLDHDKTNDPWRLRSPVTPVDQLMLVTSS
jgi:hypothetical protein